MTASAPIRLAADNPGPYTGAGNNTWLLDGAEPMLIDAGVGAESHLDALAASLAGRPLARLFVTHAHSDHISGAAAIRARWPGVVCLKMPRADETSWTPVHDGDALTAGGRRLTALHTPGHAVDHVCLWDAEARELFSGDMALSGSTVVIPAGRGGNLNAYLRSLAAIVALDPVRLYPGHGPIIENPSTLIAQYVEHRRRRESQILGFVREGLAEPEPIVDRMYPGLDPALRSAALMTVAAHLEKLREDGRLE